MEIVVLLILILLNGFFALSEIALVSSKKIRLEHLVSEGDKRASEVLRLKENSEDYLSAIQVGITLIGIVMGVYGGVRIAGLVQPFFEMFEPIRQWAYEIALVTTVFLITYVSIVIGELVPKTIALSNPERIAVRIVPVILIFSKIFYPFVKLLAISTNFVCRLLNLRQQQDQVTETELRQMLKIASSQGVIEEGQNIIHEKVFYLSDKKARHLMTHRNDVDWLDLNQPESEIKNTIMNARHSKLLCCRGTVDDFVGFLYLSDYFKAVTSGINKKAEQMLVDPFVVTSGTNAQHILEEFKKEKIHICVVVDNQKKLIGIITLHDILEHIVGLVPNEGEDFEPEVFVREDNSVLVNGESPVEILSDLVEGFKIDFDKVDYSSVAGFVYYQLEKNPEIGDKIEVLGYEIEVIDIDGKRIDKVLISKKV